MVYKRWIFFLCIFFSSALLAEESSPVEVRLELPKKAAITNGRFFAVVQYTLQPGWHLYWKNPKGLGTPPEITWNLPEGITVAHVDWPFPEVLMFDNEPFFGYEGVQLFCVEFHVDKNVFSKKEVSIGAEVDWLVCGPSCVPGTTKIHGSFEVVDTEKVSGFTRLLERARSAVPQKVLVTDVAFDEGVFSFVVPDWGTLELDHIEFFPIDPGTTFNGKVEFEKKDSSLRIMVPLAETHRFEAVLVATTKDGKKHAIEVNIYLDVESSFFQLGSLLGLLFLSGILLNLFPCVLPVVSIKLVQLLQLRIEGRGVIRSHALFFSFGVVSSFLLLALIAYCIHFLGGIAGWGFQLQEPFFILTLIMIFFSAALLLCNLGPSGFFLAEKVEKLDRFIGSHSKNGLFRSYLSGVLATAIGSSCTGPVLGAALGAITAFDPKYIFLFFLVLGFGMALPYLFLAIFPDSLRFLPRPGAWMATFKELMAFLMFLTVLWLLWVLEGELPGFNITLGLVGLFFVFFGFWSYTKWCAPLRKKSVRFFGKIAFLFFIVLGFWMVTSQIVVLRNSSKEEQVSWSLKDVQKLIQEKKSFFLVVEARWCATCQLNHFVLESRFVQDLLHESGLLLVRLDWTKKDPLIGKFMHSLQRNGVPLYAVFRDGKLENVLPEILSYDILQTAIEKKE